MDKFYKAILTVLLMLTFVNQNFALHIIGGEMTYICLGEDPNNPGSNLYQVTMKVYRDCFGTGAAFDSAPGSNTTGTVSVYRGNSNFPFIQTITLNAPVITELDPSVVNNPCLVIPSNVCVQYNYHSSCCIFGCRTGI